VAAVGATIRAIRTFRRDDLGRGAYYGRGTHAASPGLDAGDAKGHRMTMWRLFALWAGSSVPIGLLLGALLHHGAAELQARSVAAQR
jgi:hypothetical protein